MIPTTPIECDIILAESGERIVTLSLPVVPRAGEELDLDLAGARGSSGEYYRVIGVRYHARPRRLTISNDLFGVRIIVEKMA